LKKVRGKTGKGVMLKNGKIKQVLRNHTSRERRAVIWNRRGFFWGEEDKKGKDLCRAVRSLLKKENQGVQVYG